MKLAIACLAVLGVLSTPATAQRTWIVDAAKGPGWDFTSIQAAIDAAVAGDSVVIRKGSYEAFTLAKGLRLLAEPEVDLDASPAKPVRVRNIPVEQIAVVRGLVMRDAIGNGAIVFVEDNTGSVHLEETRVEVPIGSRTEAVVAARNNALTMRACTVAGGIRLAATNAMVTETFFFRVQSPTVPKSLATIAIDGGRVTLARSSSIGADGFSFIPPGAALVAANAAVRLLGDEKSSVYKAGKKWQVGSPAIGGDSNSTLEYDRRIWILPSGIQNPIVGFGKVGSGLLPHMRLAGGKLGETMEVDLHGSPRDFYGLSVSLPGSPPFPWPPFGYLWLRHEVRIPFIGFYDATGILRVRVKIPDDSSLRGLPLAWQAVSGAWPNIVYANAAVATLH